MNITNGKTVFGAILVVIAIYLYMYMNEPAAKFLGAAIVAILGIASIIKGLEKKKEE